MAYVVIGGNFGDEGKGLITDALVRRTGARVVARFNGGAQAGHTVVSDSNRHVFGHVGAGTFAGAITMLTDRFIVNPMLLKKELDQLGPSYAKTPIFVDPGARVSTVYDVMLNAMTELKRGNARHGSCGVGINETVNRHKLFPITPVISRNRLADQLEKIRSWFLEELEARGLQELLKQEPFVSTMDASSYTLSWALYEQLGRLQIANPRSLDHEEIVYEGAQGLGLDEFLGSFPHVTRSITGLPNAIMHAASVGIRELTPVYVTRAYLTRHGAGPMPNEDIAFHEGPNPADATNQPNPWQGSLRFAPLNLPMLESLISKDRDRARILSQVTDVKINTPVIALTCVDQLVGDVRVITSMGPAGKMLLLEQVPPAHLPTLIEQELNLKVLAVSSGPSARDVNWVV